MERPSPRARTLSEDLERRHKDGRLLGELRGLLSQDRKHPCARRRSLSLCLGLPDGPRQFPSLLGKHPDVFVATLDERRRTPQPFRTDAPRTSRAPVRARRGAFEDRRAPFEDPRAPFAAPRATTRAGEGAMLTPRDAPPIRGDALLTPEDALRVRRASPCRLSDAVPGGHGPVPGKNRGFLPRRPNGRFSSSTPLDARREDPCRRSPRERRSSVSAKVVSFQLFVEGSKPDSELRRGEAAVPGDGCQRALYRLPLELRE
jgi:hypothetical protein